MVEAQKASFSFEEFKVSQFSFDEENHTGSELKIWFIPSGKYNSTEGIFEVMIKFIAHEGEDAEKAVFRINSNAIFKFNSPIQIEEIPSYFYMNAIAIVFPYIRAFISTLTLQANTRLLKLGLMNLSALEKPLKENTIVI
ncbi:MAG: Protein-export protein SecB [Adhaeribacter sp.]|nr:Protein-export protein SecB [Adhaeribacter sp.]